MGLIISLLVAVAGFLGLFHALVAIPAKSCIDVAPDLYLISNEIDLLLIVACLLLAWCLGYLQKENFAFRQVGTRFYGHEQTDQGYIATKWLTFGFPLVPIRSYVVIYPIKEFSNLDFQFQRNVMQPTESYFHLPQVIKTAFISYGTLFWAWGSLWVMLNSGFCLK